MSIRFFPLVLISALALHAQPSRYELHGLPSAIVGRTMYYNIYLPEGYDSSTDVYPVVYLFRGHEREWANPTEDGFRRGSIRTVADSLIAAGRIGRVILVMPGLSAPAADKEFAYVASELIPHIDSLFRTIPTRWKRGMDGFSYGGLSVIQLLWRSPARFATAGSYDGSFWAFDLNLLGNADNAYWAQLQAMGFFTHCANAPDGNNKVSVLNFINILQSHGLVNAFNPPDVAPVASHNWYFADLHMGLSLPLHWQKFQSAPISTSLTMTGDPFASIIGGIVNMTWNRTGPPPMKYIIQYSRNDGNSWDHVQRLPGTATGFSWNTVTVPDGTRNRLRILAVGDTVFGEWKSDSSFVIDNPGNGAPDVQLLAPAAGQRVTGSTEIRWKAADPEAAPVSVSLHYKSGGAPWQTLATGFPNTGSFVWDSRSAPNSRDTRIKIRCSDGELMSEDSSRTFVVENERYNVPPYAVHHVQGTANALILPRIVDLASLNAHTYRIGFDDSSAAGISYWVRDMAKDTLVVTEGGPLDGVTEGPLFNGIRLVIDRVTTPVVDAYSSRWTKGSSNLLPRVFLDEFLWLGNVVHGIPFPADYRITIADHVVDTSAADFGLDATPMKFSVRNVTEGKPVKVMFSDLDADQNLGMLDAVAIMEQSSSGPARMSWTLSFDAVANPIAPAAGDEFELRISKPLTSKDVYEFAMPLTGARSMDNSLVPGAVVLHQNFPNPFNPATVIRYDLGSPADVRLTVFDLLGRQLVVLVNRHSEAGAHTVSWDASDLPSGVYFYRLTTGGRIMTKSAILIR